MLGFFLFRAYRICFYCLVVGLISFNLFPFAFVNFCIFRKGVIIWEKMNVKCVIALNVKLLCEEKASKTHTNTPHLALHFWIGGLAGIQLSLEEKYQINVNGSFVWFRPTAVSTYHLDILSSFSFFWFFFIFESGCCFCAVDLGPENRLIWSTQIRQRERPASSISRPLRLRKHAARFSVSPYTHKGGKQQEKR